MMKRKIAADESYWHVDAFYFARVLRRQFGVANGADAAFDAGQAIRSAGFHQFLVHRHDIVAQLGIDRGEFRGRYGPLLLEFGDARVVLALELSDVRTH